jgi:hypothetical protein
MNTRVWSPHRSTDGEKMCEVGNFTHLVAILTVVNARIGIGDG